MLLNSLFIAYLFFLSLLQDLPHEYVPPDMLKKVANHGATNKVYACEVSRHDHLIRIKGGKFDAKEYDEHPNRYISVFSKKVNCSLLLLFRRHQQFIVPFVAIN